MRFFAIAAILVASFQNVAAQTDLKFTEPDKRCQDSPPVPTAVVNLLLATREAKGAPEYVRDPERKNVARLFRGVEVRLGKTEDADLIVLGIPPSASPTIQSNFLLWRACGAPTVTHARSGIRTGRLRIVRILEAKRQRIMTNVEAFISFLEQLTPPRDVPVKEELEQLVLQMRRGGFRYSQAVREFQRSFLATALREQNGNQVRAAQKLGIHRNTLRLQLRALELDTKALRAALRPKRFRRRAYYFVEPS